MRKFNAILILFLLALGACTPEVEEKVNDLDSIDDLWGKSSSLTQLTTYQAKVKSHSRSSFVETSINSNIACSQEIDPNDKILDTLKCSDQKVAVCHVPKGNPSKAHIIKISQNAFFNTQFDAQGNRSFNYLVDCNSIDVAYTSGKHISCEQKCSNNLIVIDDPTPEDPVETPVIVSNPTIIEEDPIDIIDAPIVDEPALEPEPIDSGEPFYFDQMSSEELRKVCNDVCGEEFNSHNVRDFYQLYGTTYPHNKGLVCGSGQRYEEATPCHKYPYFEGVHMFNLAPEKLEVHRGSYAESHHAKWCVAYHERDFPYLNILVAEKKIIAGQVACLYLTDSSSL
jgi:hypothetical protein